MPSATMSAASLTMPSANTECSSDRNITSIKRLYQPRTQTGPWIWSGFTANAIRHNVRCVIDNAFGEYRMFLRSEHHLHKTSLPAAYPNRPLDMERFHRECHPPQCPLRH